MANDNRLTQISLFIVASIFILGAFAIVKTAMSASSTVSVTSTVEVGNAAPTVSNISINGGSDIVLTPNATTSVSVSFTVQDSNGCNDVFFNGFVTSTAYRVGVGGACSADNLNCYTVTTTTHNCTANASTSNATATFGIYYFADSTDGASSSYPSDVWEGYVAVSDAANSTDTGTSTASVEVGVLTAIDVTTSSINYGTVSAGTDTGSTNEVATTTNVGNSSTTLRLHAVSTLASGSNSIATSSQEYATSSFAFGAGVDLTDSVTTVGGFLLTSPTSTASYAQPTFWGLEVPGGTATGTYTGTTRFTSFWQP